MNKINLNTSFQKFKTMLIQVNKTVSETIEIKPGYYVSGNTYYFIREDGHITEITLMGGWANMNTRERSEVSTTYSNSLILINNGAKISELTFVKVFYAALELIQNAINLPETV